MDTDLVETRGEPLYTIFLRYTTALGGYPGAGSGRGRGSR
jgi:hypothetical protein